MGRATWKWESATIVVARLQTTIFCIKTTLGNRVRASRGKNLMITFNIQDGNEVFFLVGHKCSEYLALSLLFFLYRV